MPQPSLGGRLRPVARSKSDGPSGYAPCRFEVDARRTDRPAQRADISVFDFHLSSTYIHFNVVLLRSGLSGESNRQDAIEVATSRRCRHPVAAIDQRSIAAT